jgi:hypothetical protein
VVFLSPPFSQCTILDAVFNKTYQLRAVRQAGGVTTKALLRLPAPWRPFVAVAAIAEEFYRPKHRPRPGKRSAAHSSQQLELFPAVPQIVPASTPDPARPLFDLFPEAYS